MKGSVCGRVGKGFCLLLAALLLLPLLGVPASAAAVKGAYFVTGDPAFAYLVTGLRGQDGADTVMLYQQETMQSYAGYFGVYTVPSQVYDENELRTYTVTEISGAKGSALGAFQNVPLKGITLPGTVTTVGNYAFAGCQNLKEATLPTSITRLSSNAFDGVELDKLTLQVTESAALSGEKAFIPGGKISPIALPRAITDLSVQAPLSVTGQPVIPGQVEITGARVTIQPGSSLTLTGTLSGAGIIQVSNEATLNLRASTAAYTGSIRLSGAVSCLVNSTALPVNAIDASGRSVQVMPGETCLGGQTVEPSEEPGENRPQITSNYGGEVSVQESGKVVYINAYEDYHVEEVVINGLSMGSLTRYEFEVASAQNTVSVTFAEGKDQLGPNPPDLDPVFIFEDVSPADSFAGAVRFLVKNGIFSGMSETRFGPQVQVNRAMLVTLLKRMEVYGEDYQIAARKLPQLIDVEEDSWYAESAFWAASLGIVPRVVRTFRPTQLVTRVDFAICLYRYTHKRGYDTLMDMGSLRRYADVRYLSSEARVAMAWAGSRGYLKAENGLLKPNAVMNRGELAAALAKYLQR